MVSQQITRRLLHTAVACSMFAAASATAQDRALVTWTGRVDKEVQITIRDTSISTSIIGGAPVKWAYFNVKDRLPMREGFVRVELEAGRGDVDVVQQPTAKNDFAAILRIRDHSAGVDDYSVKAFWNPKNGEDRYSSAAALVRSTAAPLALNTMHWTGSVDRELRIEWRGLNVLTRNQSGETPREVHSSVSNALPSMEALIEMSVREGRGDVSIIQQPNSSNGYTAIFKVRDPQSGFGRYEFDVTWR